jgi:hypothetical protein
MPNSDFYAVGVDFGAVLDFIFEQPGWILVESSSRPDMPLQRFSSTAAVLRAVDPNSHDVSFELYSPAMGGGIVEHAVRFTPGAVTEKAGRMDARGWGLIQLHLRSSRGGPIRPCNTGHNSERRARAWEVTYLAELGSVSQWNWREVERISRRLNSYIGGSRSASPAAEPSSQPLPKPSPTEPRSQ